MKNGGGSNALADGVAVAKELLACEGNTAAALRRYEGPPAVRWERSIPKAKGQCWLDSQRMGWRIFRAVDFLKF
jgi:hypothetical protein